MLILTRLFLCANALGFLLIGIHTFMNPYEVVRLNLNVSALNEARANYGGMHIGMALFLLLMAFRPQWTRVGLWWVVFFVGGLLAGRAVSMVLEGMPNAWVWSFTLLEVVTCLGALLLLYFGSRPR